MGYTTEFDGEFSVSPPLRLEHATYLRTFSQTRRMKRDSLKTSLRSDPVREGVSLPVGDEGAYFVGEDGFKGQDIGPDVINPNIPPVGQPGLWCQWTPSEDGSTIQWDGGEKFYDYIEWIRYLIEHFLEPWGYTLSGEVRWEGEDHEDMGLIHISHNLVKVKIARITYEDEE